MLILRGILRKVGITDGGVSRQTGQILKPKSYLEFEVLSRGELAFQKVNVPDHTPYAEKIGQVLNLPVSAFTPPPGKIFYTYDPSGLSAMQDLKSESKSSSVSPVARAA